MNEIKKMFCPNCGGPVSFQPGREDAFCSHCGSQLYFEDDKLEVKLKHEEVKMEYADKSEARQHEIEKKKIENKEERFYMFVLIGVMVFMWLLLMIGVPIITNLFPPK